LQNNPERRGVFDDHQTSMRGFGLLKATASLHVRPEQSLSENAGYEPHTSNEDSPIDALLSGKSGSVFGQCHEDGPDKAREFSGDGSDGHMAMFAFIKPEELVNQTELGLDGNGDDLGWLPLTPAF